MPCLSQLCSQVTRETGDGVRLGWKTVPLAALSSVLSTAAPGEAQHRGQALQLYGRVSAELCRDPSQVSGPDQSRSQQGREDRDRSMSCGQALTLLPGPKTHPAVLTGLHHPCAGAGAQLSAQLCAEFITLQ